MNEKEKNVTQLINGTNLFTKGQLLAKYRLIHHVKLLFSLVVLNIYADPYGKMLGRVDGVLRVTIKNLHAVADCIWKMPIIMVKCFMLC